MKKIVTFAAIAAISFGASAQLKVVNNGQSQMGTFLGLPFNNDSGVTTLGLDINPIEPITMAAPDSLAPILVRSLGVDGSWPRISFGDFNSASIGLGEATDKKRGNSMLTLKSTGGLEFYGKNTKVFHYTAPSSGSLPATFYFTGIVSARQHLTASDARLKTDIEELDNAGAQLRNLVPVSYVFTSDSTGAPSEAENGIQTLSADGDASGTRHQYGFLAQDVREIFPDLVYEDADGMLSLDYQGFIPILVDAVKSLQTKVDEQAETIRTLTGQQNGQQTDGSVVASLSQNRPNPFSASTVITCTLPDNVATAFLCVYDLNGNQKLRRDITSRGNVDVTIDGNSLNAGMYIYTLIADGMEVDSKRMILTD